MKLGSRWQSLVDLKTEMVPLGKFVEATMVAEFDQQSGFVLPWFRDHGPIVGTASGGHSVWFDAALTRDGKHDRHVLEELPRTVSRNWQTRVAEVPLHVEGGMLLSIGLGVVVAARTIVDQNRQYSFTDEVIDSEMRRITGADQIVFVDTLLNEATEHIDLFMTFTGPRTVVVGQYEDQTDPNAERLDRVAQTLGDSKVDGQPIQVERIPMLSSRDGVFRSYTNVIYANGVLLVPSYPGIGDQVQQRVRQTYQRLLPQWRVEFIDCSQLCVMGGMLHCLVSNLAEAKFTPVYPKGT